ncbi:hypothetical protein ATJ97_3136 [Georgenia soli]|uniref:Uncharacterized protein n=1 Tax=Georgenia soli TaxID=638953 RepID=A0A2A9EQR9_9MICO|nr:hypothetical protein [Georgenia soli]PFG40605.1 hypothetical protein ATJ97_3136 [Georgenia soli]
MSATGSRRPDGNGTAAKSTGQAARLKFVACRDCTAASCEDCGGVHHDTTCPVGRTLAKVERNDLRWFAARPYATERRRPANWAEAASVELESGFLPSHVHVIRGSSGQLAYGYGDSTTIRVMVIVGGGRRG